MITIQQKIVSILKDYDSKKQIKREDLLSMLHDQGEFINDREMRRVIEKMVTDGHYPVGSTHKGGYYYLHCIDDLVSAENELSAKIEALAIRKHSLRRNFEEMEMAGKYQQVNLL